MYTLFHPGVLPGLASLHGLASPVTSKDGQPSRGGLLAPLARFARRPVSALGNLVDEIRTYSEDSAIQKQVEERKCLLRLSLRSASTSAEWKAAATELDELEGNNPWKLEDGSTEYNFALIRDRLDALEDARISCDASRMVFLIRTALHRYLGGMGNLQLYKHSHIGTKRLIERYISSTLETISSLVEITRNHPDTVDSRGILEQIVAARQSFGRSALLLSGGGTFGMSHIGVVKCLWEAQLLPRIVSGASAGSIVCAVLCTRKDDEIPDLLEEFCYGDLEVFTKTGQDVNAMVQITRFLKTGALFDISNLTRVMKNLLGDLTFQEAYNRTRRILNITVSSAGVFELPRLLNYVTAPNVIIWSAVAASCSVPVIFSPADILAKDPRTGQAVRWNPSTQRWIDGSVDNDLPMTRLSEMFNVNHFIVSQVNPHVTPFLARQEKLGPYDDTQNQVSAETGPGWLPMLANLAKDETLHRMAVLSELGIFPNLMTKTRSILSQRYSGDITILPEVSLAQMPRILRNPNTDFMLQATAHGERATWPKLSRIQNHCAIELALDDAVQAIKSRVAFSPSQANLRLNSIYRPLSRAESDGGRAKRSNRNGQRFSEENLRGSLKWNRPSRTPSRVNSGLADLSRIVTEPKSMGTRVQKQTSQTKIPQITTKPPESPPMFSTASDGDDDTEDDTDTAATPLDQAQYDSSDADDDYFARSHQADESKRLFPYSSQPSTPLSSNRRSYFNSNSPVLASSTAPLGTFSMKTASQGRLNPPVKTRWSSHNSSVSLVNDGTHHTPLNHSNQTDTVEQHPSAITSYHESLQRKLKSSSTWRSRSEL